MKENRNKTEGLFWTLITVIMILAIILWVAVGVIAPVALLKWCLIYIWG